MPAASDRDHREIDAITILQNRWYNSLTSHLNLDRKLFQIRYSVRPIISYTQELWESQNIIPPLSLTFNSSVHMTRRFSNEYVAIVSQLQFPESTFREDIGEDIYQKWITHLNKLTPPPPDSKLPILFRQWSLIAAPSATSVGVSDLSRKVLIGQARNNLRPYLGPNGKMIDFRSDHAQMTDALNNSVGAIFVFDSNTSHENVDDTWTGGNSEGRTGLFSDSDNASLSQQFAKSHIRADVKLGSYAVFTSVPGLWYSSSLLNLAYSTRTAPPWPEKPRPSWEDFFGQGGTMRRAIISLVLADKMHVTVVSDATYSKTEQESIQRNALHGVWPFYIPSENNTVSNVVTFDSNSGMKIETVTQNGKPLIIGNNVLAIAQYLGHGIP